MMNFKFIEVIPGSNKDFDIRKKRIKEIDNLNREISRLNYEIKFGYLTMAEIITNEKLIKAYQKEKMNILEELYTPNYVYRIPVIDKKSKEASALHPEIYKKKTKKNIKKNI